MVLFNYSTRELTAKIVYYGPGLCGKTTNLQFTYESLPDNVKKGKMLSLATKTDRTLFFDFLPLELGRIRGMKTRVQLYTVPGQVFYNSTRKLVLKGADGVVFIADSQSKMLEANAESYKNLEDNLREMGLRIEETPLVMQFNKRDLPHLASIEEMNAQINRHNAPFYEAVATTGIGVEDTLKAIAKLVLNNLSTKYKLEGGAPPAEAPAPRRGADQPQAAGAPRSAPPPRAAAPAHAVAPAAARAASAPAREPARIPAPERPLRAVRPQAPAEIEEPIDLDEPLDLGAEWDDSPPSTPSPGPDAPIDIGPLAPGQEKAIDVPVTATVNGRPVRLTLKVTVRLPR